MASENISLKIQSLRGLIMREKGLFLTDDQALPRYLSLMG